MELVFRPIIVSVMLDGRELTAILQFVRLPVFTVLARPLILVHATLIGRELSVMYPFVPRDASMATALPRITVLAMLVGLESIATPQFVLTLALMEPVLLLMSVHVAVVGRIQFAQHVRKSFCFYHFNFSLVIFQQFAQVHAKMAEPVRTLTHALVQRNGQEPLV